MAEPIVSNNAYVLDGQVQAGDLSYISHSQTTQARKSQTIRASKA